MTMPILSPSQLCHLFPLQVLALATLGLALPVPAAVEQPPAAQPVPARIEIAAGPFDASWESLRRYQCPDWFRDAKLGIWGIIGPQSLPEAGDWYARNMYIEGHRQYLFHLEHFGHPSKFGYKEFLGQWKAEKFDPERLMALYKNAGAKYFVVLANHHDNYDCWDSRYHRWNSVNVGPKKDIVGLWAQAAKKQGLRFGVSEHLARSYSWFNTNKGSDKNGDLAGVPYDGNDPKFADLYMPPHNDTVEDYPINPPEWWPRQWFWRIRDLVDTYHPDLLYTDGGIPFGEVGRSLLAHYYNANLARHGGKLEAVYNLKDWNNVGGCGDYVEGIGVQDIERGGLDLIKAEPWQTDTCIGDWFYKTGCTYKPAKHVIAMLADIVSKNGNLLLNIPIRHDGSIDANEEKVLADLAKWISIHGEAIYGTRPWQVFGEGPERKSGRHFSEKVFAQMTARDVRFTTKGGVLYAIAMGWPDDGKLLIHALATPAGKIDGVSLLGYSGKLLWTQSPEGLRVTLPATIVSQDAIALKIIGRDLKPATTAQSAILPIPEAPIDVERIMRVAARKLAAFDASQKTQTEYPTDAKGATWRTVNADNWVSGFYPGALWYLYEYAKAKRWPDAEIWRARAEAWTAGLEKQQFNTGTHDLGFMMFDSYGNGYRITKNPAYRLIINQSAQSLATRYLPRAHLLRSWGKLDDMGNAQVIIDNMMNLELLMWAAQNGGTTQGGTADDLRKIAISHAEQALELFFRPDGSTYRVVELDPKTGEIKLKRTEQGKANGSTWSRGQAWAIYGFAYMYEATGDQRYLDASLNAAIYYLVRLPADLVPPSDFNSTLKELEFQDSSAAAIAACAFFRLYRLVDEPVLKQKCRDAAIAILRSLTSAPYFSEKDDKASLLVYSARSYHTDPNHYLTNTSLIWGDYYLLEAMLQYQALIEPVKPNPAKPEPKRSGGLGE